MNDAINDTTTLTLVLEMRDRLDQMKLKTTNKCLKGN